MVAHHLISILMVLMGTVLMVWAISNSLKLHRQVPEELRRRWVLLTGLMIFFHFGYLGFVVILISEIIIPLELWAATIMLAGAVFVLIFVRLGEITIFRTKESALEKGEINEELIELNTSLQVEIGEREKISEQLRNSKAHLENIFNNSIPLCITSYDHIVIEANDAYRDIFGELSGEGQTKCFDSRPGPSCKTPNCPMARISEGDMEVACESVKVDADGAKHHYMVTARPFIDYDGQVIGIIESFQDITELKMVEKALGQEKDRLFVTLKSISVGVIATDFKGDVLVTNEAARKLIGFEEEEITGKRVSGILVLRDPGDNKPIEDPAGKILKAERAEFITDHAILTARDGFEKDVSFRVSPIFSREEGVDGVVLVLQDISDKIRIEKEMAKVQKLESIGLLAGGIAHDFNNILTAIMNNLALAKIAPDEKGKLLQRIESMEDAVMKAKQLTGQLLTFAKGGAPIKKGLPIGDMLKDAVGFALHGSKVKCEFDIAGDLWAAEYDITQVQQVVSNLVINADQAMNNGGVLEVTAENCPVGEHHESSLRPGKYVKICFKDEGCGIKKGDIPKLFDPYFTTKPSGSGLGLAMVYSIVKRHGGHLEVDSEVGKGSQFAFFLPAADFDPELECADDSDGNEKSPRLEADGKRILIMDDDADINQLIREYLEEEGFTVDCAADGEAAVKEYQQSYSAGKSYDCVVMDLTVPGGMGGKEAIDLILKIDPEVKAIVSSGYSNDPVMADHKKHGFVEMAVKPYKPEELIRKIYQVISTV